MFSPVSLCSAMGVALSAAKFVCFCCNINMKEWGKKEAAEEIGVQFSHFYNPKPGRKN